jgi:hypothetical protein
LLYNVNISYVLNGNLITNNTILHGYPTEDAAVCTRTVMLTNSTVTAANGKWSLASDELQMVEVRLTVWQV